MGFLEILFAILMFMVFGKLLIFALKVSWGITKIFFTIVFLPVILVVMVLMGFMTIALPILVVIGIISLLLK